MLLKQILLVMGIVLIASGLAAALNPGFFRRVLGGFHKNPPLVFTMGMLNLAVGLFLVLNHNIWNAFPAVVLTIVGWAAIVRGFIMMVMPKTFMKAFKFVWLGGHLRGEALFLIIVGAVLVYIS